MSPALATLSTYVYDVNDIADVEEFMTYAHTLIDAQTLADIAYELGL